MKHLICYNSLNGDIYSDIALNERELNNIETLIADIDFSKELYSINPETKEPIYIKSESSIEQRLEALEASQLNLDEAIIDLANTVYEEE